MPITDPAQAGLGNTLSVDGAEVVVVDTIPSGNGGLSVLKAADSVTVSLAHTGDLLDSDKVDFVSGPAAPGQGQEQQSREAAQDAEIANLRSQVDYLRSQGQPSQQSQPSTPEATPAPAPEVAPSTDATGATDTPAVAPGVDQAPPTTTIQEG